MMMTNLTSLVSPTEQTPQALAGAVAGRFGGKDK